MIACSNRKEDGEVLLKLVPSTLLCAEDDTLTVNLFADATQVNAQQWMTSLGTISTNGVWIAPAHVETDSVPVTITATYQQKQASTLLYIRKKALLQTLVRYAQTIQPLLNSNCNFSGCHANGSRAGKVELSIYDSVLKNVIPYSADASKLYYSLIKTDPLRVMPPAGKLHASKIQSVWLWIEQGARNN
jgi:hypothetical protein